MHPPPRLARLPLPPNDPPPRRRAGGRSSAGLAELRMSAQAAALIAHTGFWLLLVYGWFWEEIGPRGIAVFVGLWLAGFVGLRFVPYGDGLFPSFVAVLDIGLVFAIFKGDVPLR